MNLPGTTFSVVDGTPRLRMRLAARISIKAF
jgi:hypothetical protein